MKSILVITILAGLLLVTGCATGGYSYYERERAQPADTVNVMTKQDIISLTRAGVSDSVIIAMMDASGSYFQLKAQDVIDLKNAGVSDKVIRAMVVPPPSSPEERYRAYYEYYPPYPWYGGYPYWYPAFYFGFAARYPHYFYGGHVFAPRHASFGFRGYRGGHSYGGTRSTGRRR